MPRYKADPTCGALRDQCGPTLVRALALWRAHKVSKEWRPSGLTTTDYWYGTALTTVHDTLPYNMHYHLFAAEGRASSRIPRASATEQSASRLFRAECGRLSRRARAAQARSVCFKLYNSNIKSRKSRHGAEFSFSHIVLLTDLFGSSARLTVRLHRNTAVRYLYGTLSFTQRVVSSRAVESRVVSRVIAVKKNK